MLIYLRQEGRGIGLVEKLRAYNLQDEGLNTFEANVAMGHDEDARSYEDAVRILEYFGIGNIELLTNNPLKVEAMRSQGITVARRMPVVVPQNPDNAEYMKAKEEITGHLF